VACAFSNLGTKVGAFLSRSQSVELWIWDGSGDQKGSGLIVQGLGYRV
jgi:hypothetical protein